MDRLLKRYLKNWAAQQETPDSIRTRMLLMATSQSYLLNEPTYYGYREEYQTPKEFFSLHVNEPAKVFDIIWVFQLPLPALRMV